MQQAVLKLEIHRIDNSPALVQIPNHQQQPANHIAEARPTVRQVLTSALGLALFLGTLLLILQQIARLFS